MTTRRLDRDEFTVDRCNWIPFDAPPDHFEVTAKIRYNHPGTPATVTPLGGGKANGEAALAPTRHHPRTGGRVLSG